MREIGRCGWRGERPRVLRPCRSKVLPTCSAPRTPASLPLLKLSGLACEHRVHAGLRPHGRELHALRHVGHAVLQEGRRLRWRVSLLQEGRLRVGLPREALRRARRRASVRAEVRRDADHRLGMHGVQGVQGLQGGARGCRGGQGEGAASPAAPPSYRAVLRCVTRPAAARRRHRPHAAHCAP